MRFSPLKRVVPAVAIFLAAGMVAAAPGPKVGFDRAFGQKFKAQKSAKAKSHFERDPVRRWNAIALDATALDHTPPEPGDTHTFGEQLGPGRASRAMAIVHIAMCDALTALTRRYESFTGVQAGKGAHSYEAAIAQAARDTLVALYPSQQATFDQALAAELAGVSSKKARANGADLGRRVAATLLATREADGSEVAEVSIGIDYFTDDAAGRWRQDPVSLIPVALGAGWGKCLPFVLEKADHFRVPPPPAMESAEYAAAYEEAKSLGGDGIITPTVRTPEQTFIGIFWAYDGTPSLCAPPRLYNLVALQIAQQTRLDTHSLARLLALVNVAMADAGMAAWDSKYHWDFWRPVIGIREAEVGHRPERDRRWERGHGGRPDLHAAGRAREQFARPEFHPALPGVPVGARRFWRGVVPDAAAVLRDRQYRVHLCFR